MDFAQDLTGDYYWVVYSVYSRAITACARAGEAEKAVELLEAFYLRTRIDDFVGGAQGGGAGFYFGSDREAGAGPEGGNFDVGLADLDVSDRAAFDYLLGGGIHEVPPRFGDEGQHEDQSAGPSTDSSTDSSPYSSRRDQSDAANLICYTVRSVVQRSNTTAAAAAAATA